MSKGNTPNYFGVTFFKHLIYNFALSLLFLHIYLLTKLLFPLLSDFILPSPWKLQHELYKQKICCHSMNLFCLCCGQFGALDCLYLVHRQVPVFPNFKSIKILLWGNHVKSISRPFKSHVCLSLMADLKSCKSAEGKCYHVKNEGTRENRG